MTGAKKVPLGHGKELGTGTAPSRWLKIFKDAVRSRAKFILDGDNYFAAVASAIGRAKTGDHYIYILGWMIEIDFGLAGPGTTSLLTLLSEAAQRGVEIRVLVWDNFFTAKNLERGIRNIPLLNKLTDTKAFLDTYTYFPPASKDALKQMAPKIQQVIEQYGYLLPLVQRANGEMPVLDALLKLSFLLDARTLGAQHDKVVVIKNETGLVAYCGGMDFNPNRVTSIAVEEDGVFRTEYPSVHDTAAEVTGAAAWDVLQRFKRRWAAHREASQVGLRGMDEVRPPAETDPDYAHVQVVGTYNSVDGKVRDRSLMTAYLDIVKNARRTIYIEDQYMAHLEVAKLLNQKIKEPDFQYLMFALQDSIETSDVLIPNRVRDNFAAVLLDGTTQAQKDKVLFAVVDAADAARRKTHPGMHAKTLVADDEICIIGSANLSRRSFTTDSETCAVMFSDGADGLARSFRATSWKEYIHSGGDDDSSKIFDRYFNLVRKPPEGFSSLLVPYGKHAQDDLDEKIKQQLDSGLDVVIAALGGSGDTLVALRNLSFIFQSIWDNFIDPDSGGP